MLFDPPTKGDLAPKGCLRIGLIGILVILLLCGGWVVLMSSPIGDCFDFMSGHAPHAALEEFIRRVVEVAAAQDYEWLATVSDPEAVEALKEAQPIPSKGYGIKFGDDLAGDYYYDVVYDNGLELHLTLESIWPECPDRDVTEQEILEHIRLEDVSASRRSSN